MNKSIKKSIEVILKSHIDTVNSFVDKNGKNHFPLAVEELNTLVSNLIWTIGADIMKYAGVKRIKTTYHK